MSNNPTENSYETIACVQCGSELHSPKKKFCSSLCKQRHFYKDHFHSKQLRGWQRKVELVNIKGGKCERCNYDKCLSALCFHHLDPTEKESGLSVKSLHDMTWEQILLEASKCILLCHNCHAEEHYGNSKYSKFHLELSN